MSVGLNRASTYAIKKETTIGAYNAPAVGADFIPLRPKNELKYEPEQLSSDEILNDIGAAKGFTGKEKVSGSLSAYLRHSGVEGQEPQLGVLYESCLGTKHVATVEYSTVAGSTANIIKVGAGEGLNYVVGQAVLVKNGVGYEIRNVSSISGDFLTLNFSLVSTPAAGLALGKAITYIPAAQGHPTFSGTKYIGGGFAKEVSAGNTVTDLTLKMDANGFGEADFSFEGTKYYFNPIVITSSNKYLDISDDEGVAVAIVAEGIYKTPISLADALQVALEALNIETYLVTFSSVTGKFTINTGSLVLSLLLGTGVNAANSIGPSLGFTATNKSGALTYTSDNIQTYATSITPAYDSSDAVIIKGAELCIGTQTDNVKIAAQKVTIKVSKKVTDVDSIAEENGVLEKVPTSRSVELTISAVLKKHDVSLLDALLKNSGISAMINAGPKTGGNWVPGKCFNAYLQKCTVSQYTTAGESFIQANITLKGFVTSTEKDIFLGFV